VYTLIMHVAVPDCIHNAYVFLQH